MADEPLDSTSAWVRARGYSRGNWILLVAIILGVAARIVYWVYTNHAFEDALITVTQARNAAEGIGLTPNYAVGHVQGFTSALSVLVPLVGEMVHRGEGLNATRLASIVAFVAASVFAYLLANRLRISRWATGFLLTYLALDYNNIMYGMSGMETQLAVCAVLAVAYFVLTEDFFAAGIAIGLSILTRPDFLLLAGPAVFALWARNHRKGLQSAAIAVAVLAPWVIFTTIYYGSPVPHTILAKEQAYVPPIGRAPASFWHFVTTQVQQHEVLWRYLAPFVEAFPVVKAPLPGGVLKAIALIVVAMAWLGAWATRRVPGWWSILTYIALFVLYQVFLLPPAYYDWYVPPFAALLMVLVGAGLTRVAAPALMGAGLRISLTDQLMLYGRPILSSCACVVLSLLFAWQVPTMYPLDREVQQIENHVRVKVGLYLAGVVKRGQAVGTESAGYIGYYSHAELYDYPGLTSPIVYSTLHRLGPARNSLGHVIAALQPTWAVLRPSELSTFKEESPGAAAEYHLVKKFQGGPSVFSNDGVTYSDGDTEFYVLRHQ